MALYISPTTVRSSSVYTLSFSVSSATPTTALVKIQLPSDCSIATSTTYSCSFENPLGSTSSAYCVSDSTALTVTVHNFFSSSAVSAGYGFPFTITLNAVTNPKSNKPTSSIGISTTTSDGTVIDSDNSNSDMIITATAATVASTSISSSSQVVGTSSCTYTFTYTPKYDTPSGSVIYVKFPYWNSIMNPTSTDLKQMITNTSPSCVGTSSNIASALTCTYSTSTMYLKVYNGFTSTATGTVTFTVSSITNPPNPYAVTGFILYIKDSLEYDYEVSSSFSVQVTSPNTITITDSGISASPKTVSTSTTIDLSFTIKNPMASGYLVDLTIPSEISFDTSMTVIGKSSVQKITLTRTITGTKIRITNGYTAYSSTTFVWVQLTLMTNPSSTKPSSTFTVSTLTPDEAVIDTATGGTLTATAGTLTQNGSNKFITADSYVVGTLTTYYIEFVIAHSLPSGAALTVTFPQEIVPTAVSATACASVITNVGSSATCGVSSQILTVLGGFASGLTANSIVKFGVSSITNPTSTAPSSTFTITAYTDSTILYQIDTLASGITFTAISASLVSVVVTPGSDVVGSVCTYDFKITTKTKIPQYGYLIVIFPSGVSISDTTNAASNCLKVSGFNSGTFSCTVTSSQITVTTAFDSGSFSPGLLEFNIGYVSNPTSTKSVQSFSVTTYDKNAYTIDSLSTNIAVKVNTMNDLTAATASMSSLINGASTTYTFSVTPKTSTPTSCIVTITPPSTVAFPSTPTCTLISSIISSISCTIVSTTHLQATLTLTSTATSSNSISFSVANVVNPPSTQTTTTFYFYTYTSDNYGIDKKESGVTVATTTAATISSILITADDSKIAVVTTYTLNYVPINIHPSGTVLTIVVPTEFTIGSIVCSSTTLTSLTCSKSSNTLVTSGFEKSVTSAENIVILMTAITNPSTLVTTSVWTITSKTGSYLVDTSNSITSTFTCSSPCLTCTTISTKCISCLSTGSYPYLYSDTCNAACPDGQVDDISTTDKVCVSCSSICKTCKDYTTYCISCTSGSSYPYLYDNTCNSGCLQGYYGDGTNCIACTNPCLTCSSSTVCLSCTIKNTSPDFGSLTYLYSGTCVVTCPVGYLPNTSTLACEACQSPCVTCSTTTTTCTSCTSPLYLLGTTCTSSCPSDGTYIVSGSVCLECTSPCNTCTTTVTTCSSCDSGYSLYGTTCVSSCPSGYVSVSSVCTICKSPCATCTTSTLICSTCIDDYVLYSTTCLTACPAGYVSDGIKCVVCDSSCFTCEGAADICTSCTNGLNLFSYDCLASCPDESYVAIANVCEKCASPCATCSSTTTFCKSCISGYKLHSNTCVLTCPTNSIDNGSSCSDCSTNCLTCSGTINTCTSCASGKYLEANICVGSCSGGYVLIGTVCEKCNSVCFTCSTTTNYCDSCITNYYMLNNYCYTECPENYIIDAGACVEVIATDCNTDCTEALLANTGCDQVCNVAACQYDMGNCIGPTSCLDGQYQVDDECFDCSDPCNKCTAPVTCLTCMVDDSGFQWLFYEVESFCYATCPTGTYKDSLSCVDCDTKCTKCSGSASTCTECVSPYLLYNNQCLASCLSDITIKVDTQCIDCDSNCKYCSGTTTTCTACDTDRVLQGTVCQVSCNSGYTTTSSSLTTCVACSGCLTCSGSTTTCITCDPSLYLYNSQCLSSCPSGTYTNGNICSTCDSSCVTCEGAGSCTSCISEKVMFGALCLSACPAGYEDTDGVCTVIVPAEDCVTGCTSSLLNNGLCDQVCNTFTCNYDNQFCEPQSSECPAGEYFDGSACSDCLNPCLTCASETACTACEVSGTTGTTMYLYNTVCYDACPAGTMANGIMCEACDSACKECAVTTSTCISCESGKYLYSGTCVSSCPTLTTVALSTVCEICNTNCKTCVTTIDTCASCPTGYVLQGTVCKSSCDGGYTLTTAYPSTCQACTNSCATCSGETYTCTSCSSGHYLYSSQCVTSCPSKVTVISGNTCISCTSPCAECLTYSTSCTLCVSGYYLSGTSCVSSCPTGYESILGVCTLLCSDGCTSSDLIDTTCQLSCNTLACNYDNGYCVTPTVCDTYQYQDGSSCIDCTYPCNTCTSDTYCLSCKTSTTTLVQLYYYSGKCYDSCPDGTYLNGIVCSVCDSNCLTCKTTSTNCLTCSSPYKIHNSECVLACPVGTSVEISSVCYDCSNICEQCSGTITTCTKCYTGTVLSQGTCIAECPDGYTTTDTSNGECMACSTNCKTCLSLTTKCTSCPDGKYLFDSSTCVSTCPSGYTVTLSDPTICTQCSSSSHCLECEDFSTYCTDCVSDYTLTSANTCQAIVIVTCPDGTTQTSSTDDTCYNCLAPCSTCSGSTSYCLTCQSPLVASSGSCVSCTEPCSACEVLPTICLSCISGYYLSGTTCKTCTSPCITCTGAATSCNSCADGYYLSGTSCPKCVSNCLTCLGTASTCTSCADSKFLENNFCVDCSSSCLTCEAVSTKCTSCSSSYYLTSSNTCSICSSICKTCSSSSTYCTSCNTGFTLIGNTCGVCDSTCATCSSSYTYCDTCASGLTLIAGICATCSSDCKTCVTDHSTCGSCNDGKYLSSGKCLNCDSTCKTCTGLGSYCTSCDSPYILFSSTCDLCDSLCKTCSGSPSTCTSCTAPLTLIGNSCLQCINDCKTCAGTTSTCLSCNDGYYLSGSDCNVCSTNCLTCDKNLNNCLTCPIGSELASGTCYYECADGYTLIGTACVLCDPTCKTCSGTVSTCTSCYSGFIYASACIENCPDGYYYTGTTCSECSSLCKTCYTLPTSCLSCETGYTLNGLTCKMICKNGQYYADNYCYECDSNCLTCETSATNCLSCKLADQIVNSDGVCEVPCPSGYLRNSNTGDCDACSIACTTCEKNTNYCTTCNDTSKYLYNGACMDDCPTNITVSVNSVCESCTSPCSKCSIITTNCTSCISGKYLYYGSCITTCPTGYVGKYGECIRCAEPDCSDQTSSSSNSSSSNSSSSSNTTSSSNTSSIIYPQNGTEFTGSPVPFPFSGTTAGTAGVIGVMKLTASGVNFAPSVISVWGITAAGSWIFLGAYLPNEGETDYSRRLLDNPNGRLLTMLDPSTGDLILSITLLIIIIALGFHLACNILYTTGFLIRSWNNDTKFKVWRKKHPVATIVFSIFSYTVTFHSVRFYYCGMCNQSCFRAEFDYIGNIKKGLVKYGYVSLLCTHFPMIAAQILMLNHFEKGYWIWMFALDSLIITVLLTFFIFCDIRNIEKDLIKHEMDKDYSLADETEKLGEPLKDLIDMFPPMDLVGMIPSRMPGRKLKKNISKSLDGDGQGDKERYEFLSEDNREGTPQLSKCHSFPKLDLAGIEIKPEEFQTISDKKSIMEEPEIIDHKGVDSFFREDPTFIQDDEIITIPLVDAHVEDEDEDKDKDKDKVEENEDELVKQGELYNSTVEYKNPFFKEPLPRYTPFNLDPRTEEFTEIIAFTEEDSSSSISVEDPVFPQIDTPQEFPKIEEIKEEQEPHMEDLEIIQDLNSTIKAESDTDSEHLGTINEENELELEKAIADVDDPEVITVPHIETGRRVKLKKDFKGARVVDLENKVVENEDPVDVKDFDIPRTVVDEEDVRFATLTHHTGSKVRVKRNFKGARIIDLEKRVSDPHGFLIGKSVESENEFNFNTAFPDPEDPEVVVVTHKETGEDVKVRKTFQNAQIVDDRGEPIPESKPIDRNDYNIPKAIIDKEDIHLATLSHKMTKARVRVRRDFKGAKIIDLEKRSDNIISPAKKIEKRRPTHITEKSEPEPLSPDLSDLEYIPFPEEEDFDMPIEHFPKPKSKNVSRPKISAGRERLADLAKIISEESKGMHSPTKDPYALPEIDSDEDFDFVPEPEVPHYRDLDDEFDDNFMPRGDSMLEDSESYATLRGAGRKRRKRGKKFRPADAFRMKGLEEIYLERQGVKKKPNMKTKFSEDILEPDMEIDDFPNENPFDSYRTPLERAGEEIVRGRGRR